MVVVGQWDFELNLMGCFGLLRLEEQAACRERFAGGGDAGFTGRGFVVGSARHRKVFRHVSLKGEGFGWGHGTARHHQSQSAQAHCLHPVDDEYSHVPIANV